MPECDISRFFGGSPHDWPTAVALRDGRLVGALATHYREDTLVCGPFVVALANPAMVAVRLIECYESYLASIGMNHYLFSLIMGEVPASYRRAMERATRLGLVQDLGLKEGCRWYRRILVSRRAWAQKLRRARDMVRYEAGDLRVEVRAPPSFSPLPPASSLQPSNEHTESIHTTEALGG